MPGRRQSRLRTGAALAPVLALACLTACAIPMAPSGGPIDKIPPELAAAHPESGSVGVEPVDRLVFLFSEKMAPDPAERFLHLYPEVEIRKTSWKGRREAHVILEEPLPADTVFVLEITSDLKDAHGVAAQKSYRYRSPPRTACRAAGSPASSCWTGSLWSAAWWSSTTSRPTRSSSSSSRSCGGP